MPGKHKELTISFRPSSWQRTLIEERAKMSGLPKKDFIARSCIYANIIVVGKKEVVQKIIDELQETQITLREVAGQLQSGSFSLSMEGYQQLKEDFLAMVVTMVDILDGVAYLFDKKPDNNRKGREQRLEDCRKALLS